MDKTNIVGIDSSVKVTALAWCLDHPINGPHWHTRHCIGDDREDLLDALNDAFIDGCRTVVLEDGYAHANMRTANALAIVRGRTIEMCDALCFKSVQLVQPSVWQSDMLGKMHALDTDLDDLDDLGRLKQGWKRRALKAASIASAKSMGASVNVKTYKAGVLVKEEDSNDLADAVNIAAWGKLNCMEVPGM